MKKVSLLVVVMILFVSFSLSAYATCTHESYSRDTVRVWKVDYHDCNKHDNCSVKVTCKEAIYTCDDCGHVKVKSYSSVKCYPVNDR